MAMRRTRTARRAVPRRRTTFRNARPWTREEIAFMRKFYRTYETAWVARQLGRTVYSVRYKAVDLNIKKASPSVWRGNTGNKNAFYSFAPGHRRTGTTRKTWGSRRKSSPRKFRAKSRKSNLSRKNNRRRW